MNKLREEIARIVDPIAFDQRDRWTVPNFNVSSTHIAGAAEDCERALTKADQIIAAWNRRADPLVEELRGALAYDAQVFAMLVAEADPAKHGKVLYLSGEQWRTVEKAQAKAREALALPVGGGASREPAQATQVSSDPTANADEIAALREQIILLRRERNDAIAALSRMCGDA